MIFHILLLFLRRIYQSKASTMAKTTNQKPDFLSPHPGSVLIGELSEHSLTQRELAVAIGKTPAVVNGIIKGDRDINSEIAILLEAALPGGLSAEDWLRLQNEHDLEKKRSEKILQARTTAIEIWNYMRENANLNVLRRRMELGNDLVSDISMIMNTLGISSLVELKAKLKTSQSCFKKSEKVQTDSSNLFTWTVIVKHASESQRLDTTFNYERTPELIRLLNEAFYENESVVEKTGKILNDFGIKFISNEKRLEKVPVDGFSFWIGENPTIVATQRMNRIDNFAFTIMHELGHIMLHLEKGCDIEYMDVDGSIMNISQQEKEANEYAILSLWGGERPESIFSEIENPYASAKVLKAIARRKRMNVGIVTGQYQFFCSQKKLVKNSYAICRDLISHLG